jgi:hypothetical protein
MQQLFLALGLAGILGAASCGSVPVTPDGGATETESGAAGAQGGGGSDGNVEIGDGGGSPTECRSYSDCPLPGPSNIHWVCIGPYVSAGCGGYDPSTQGTACTTDSQCRGLVCREDPTSRDGGGGPTGLVCTAPVLCTDDSQCGDKQVCREDPNKAGWSPLITDLLCSAPCATDLDCSPTHKCDGGGHCRARTCAECPMYFSCATGTCIIPSCSKDIDCPGGYCVNGSCAGSLGACQQHCT